MEINRVLLQSSNDKETTYLSELSAEKEHYFLALVYEDDEERKEKDC